MSRLDKIEREAVAAALGTWGGDVERLKRAVLALWSARGGVLTDSEMRALLTRLDLPKPPDLAPFVTSAAVVGDAAVPGRTAVHVAPLAGVTASIAAKPSEALTESRRRLAIEIGRAHV